MKPNVILSRSNAQCATFFWKDQPDFHVGYRFIEHDPEMASAELPGVDDQPKGAFGEFPEPKADLLDAESGDPWDRGWVVSYEEEDSDNPIQLAFKTFSDGSAWARGLDNKGDQERCFFYEPVEDGIRMWMRLRTRTPIPGTLGVQQCLRYSGATNVEWRQTVARIPFLSEFDVQALGKPLEVLSWSRRNDAWLRYPLPHTRFHTSGNSALLGSRSAGEVDHGLIVRESVDGQYASGMYWERTAYLSNRHPADCLHASVDFGPLEADASRTVQGKFYFVQGTKDDLLDHWRADFQVAG